MNTENSSQFTCPFCETDLELDNDDMSLKTFICPCCNNTVYISFSQSNQTNVSLNVSLIVDEENTSYQRYEELVIGFFSTIFLSILPPFWRSLNIGVGYRNAYDYAIYAFSYMGYTLLRCCLHGYVAVTSISLILCKSVFVSCMFAFAWRYCFVRIGYFVFTRIFKRNSSMHLFKVVIVRSFSPSVVFFLIVLLFIAVSGVDSLSCYSQQALYADNRSALTSIFNNAQYALMAYSVFLSAAYLKMITKMDLYGGMLVLLLPFYLSSIAFDKLFLLVFK